jgi:hypothetical protein
MLNLGKVGMGFYGCQCPLTTPSLVPQGIAWDGAHLETEEIRDQTQVKSKQRRRRGGRQDRKR